MSVRSLAAVTSATVPAPPAAQQLAPGFARSVVGTAAVASPSTSTRPPEAQMAPAPPTALSVPEPVNTGVVSQTLPPEPAPGPAALPSWPSAPSARSRPSTAMRPDATTRTRPPPFPPAAELNDAPPPLPGSAGRKSSP